MATIRLTRLPPDLSRAELRREMEDLRTRILDLEHGLEVLHRYVFGELLPASELRMLLDVPEEPVKKRVARGRKLR